MYIQNSSNFEIYKFNYLIKYRICTTCISPLLCKYISSPAKWILLSKQKFNYLFKTTRIVLVSLYKILTVIESLYNSDQLMYENNDSRFYTHDPHAPYLVINIYANKHMPWNRHNVR